MDLNDTQRAWLRTTWNAAVLALIVWIAEVNTAFNIDTQSPLVVAGVAAVAGIGYRLSLWLAEIAPPWVGRILFGSPTAPTYEKD